MKAHFYFCLAFLCAAKEATARYSTWCEDNNIPDNIIFAWPGWCGTYILCNNGETILGQCEEEGMWVFPGPGNTMGPGNTIPCEWPTNDDVCSDDTLVWPPPDSGDCPAGDGVVLLPSEFCDTFYVCVNGIQVEMRCRPGQHWNAEREYCDDPHRAGCESNTPPELPDCPIGFHGNLPHPTDCNLFVNCQNGNRSIQRCLHLHVFDTMERRCMVNGNCANGDYRGPR